MVQKYVGHILNAYSPWSFNISFQLPSASNFLQTFFPLLRKGKNQKMDLLCEPAVSGHLADLLCNSVDLLWKACWVLDLPAVMTCCVLYLRWLDLSGPHSRSKMGPYVHVVLLDSTPAVFFNRCSAWRPLFEVKDEHFDTILTLRGPCCIIECPCIPSLDFHVS